MNAFVVNGMLWNLYFVDPYRPELIDRTGEYRLATTDPVKRSVFVSNELTGPFLTRVLRHELGHVVMISYGLLNDVHQMTNPRYWIDMEEWICNFIADYGEIIFRTLTSIGN